MIRRTFGCEGICWRSFKISVSADDVPVGRPDPIADRATTRRDFLRSAAVGTLAQSVRSVRVGGRIAMIGIVGGLGSIDYLHLLPVIDREFPFAQPTQPAQHSAARGHIGKVVITHD